jgi:hypothetical protein
MELRLLDMAPLPTWCDGVTDTLAMAKALRPGQRNNLDALCKHYGVDNAARTLHGALLDCELLAAVYLALTRGQESLSIGLARRTAAGDRQGKQGGMSLAGTDGASLNDAGMSVLCLCRMGRCSLFHVLQIVILLIGVSSIGKAADIRVLLSDDSAPYQEAYEAIRAGLQGPGPRRFPYRCRQVRPGRT